MGPCIDEAPRVSTRVQAIAKPRDACTHVRASPACTRELGNCVRWMLRADSSGVSIQCVRLHDDCNESNCVPAGRQLAGSRCLQQPPPGMPFVLHTLCAHAKPDCGLCSSLEEAAARRRAHACVSCIAYMDAHARRLACCPRVRPRITLSGLANGNASLPEFSKHSR